MISIHINTSAVQQGLAGLRADMKWVQQNTVNDLLKGAQEAQYNTMRKNFTIRNNAFLKYSVRINFASRTSPMGTLYIGDLGGKNTSNIWNKFEGGGTKTPKTSKNVSVPSTEAWGNRGRQLSAKNKPRALPRSFVIKSGGQQYIFNRVGRRSKKTSSGRDNNIKMMYTLKDSVKIPDRLNFYSTVIPYIEQNYMQVTNKLLEVSIRKRGFTV